jgi:hypothetical protein
MQDNGVHAPISFLGQECSYESFSPNFYKIQIISATLGFFRHMWVINRHKVVNTITESEYIFIVHVSLLLMIRRFLQGHIVLVAV